MMMYLLCLLLLLSPLSASSYFCVTDHPIPPAIKEELRNQGKELVLLSFDAYKEKQPSPVLFWDPPKSMILYLKKHKPKNSSVLIWTPSTEPHGLSYGPAIYQIFDKVYTWHDKLASHPKGGKIYFPALTPPLENPLEFEKRRLAVLLTPCKKNTHLKHLYREKKAIINFFEKKPKGLFDFYGSGWNRERYQNYRGECTDPIETLKNYRFCFCYEEAKDLAGYITEKIFHCFAAGTIPIYLGAHNIGESIPHNCYIDARDFDSLQELFAYLQSFDAPLYTQYTLNIKNFLISREAQKFTIPYLVTRLLDN